MGKQYASVCETRRDSPKRPGIFDAGAFSILSFSRGCDFSVESSPANCYFRRLTKHSFRGCSFSGGFYAEAHRSFFGVDRRDRSRDGRLDPCFRGVRIAVGRRPGA